MNENINLTKILNGCPEGVKFYSPLFGEVVFIGIKDNGTIKVMEEFRIRYFRYNGQYLYRDNAECLLFPSKDQRDWSKFERFWDKPKMEKFDPKTLQPFDKVLVRRHLTDEWSCDIFSNFNVSNRRSVCVGFSWNYCIPYNEETKHLVGTTDDCPEYYKYWEE